MKFNNKAIKWLGVWLDSQLIFDVYIKKRIKQEKATETGIKGLTKSDRLFSGLV